MNFIQISDLHLDDPDSIQLNIDTRAQLIRMMESIPRTNEELIIVTGDIAEPSAVPFFYKTLQHYGYSKENVRLVFGNHDTPSVFEKHGNQEKHQNQAFYYDEHFNGCHFLFLDTHEGYVDAIQMEWIRNLLSNPLGSIVVFSHYPILDCGNTLMDRKYPLKNRIEVSNLLETTGLPVTLFCGHYHTIHQQTYKNITQYICPSSFVQIKQQADDYEIESKEIGYRRIQLTNGEIETKAVILKE